MPVDINNPSMYKAAGSFSVDMYANKGDRISGMNISKFMEDAVVIDSTDSATSMPTWNGMDHK
jgi:hypothetical protein